MNNIDNLEIRRKTFHLFLGIFFVVMIYNEVMNFMISLSFLIIGIIISFVSTKFSIPVIDWFLIKFDRPEHRKYPGRSVVAILFSVTILLLLFEMSLLSKNIILASIIIWTFGDSLSAVVGKSYGKTKHPFNKRFLEGTIAGILGSTLAAWLFLPFHVAFLGSLIVMIIESLELRLFGRYIDDNLTVPLISALILYLLV